MSFCIDSNDTLRTKRLKLIYLLPLSIVALPFFILWFGLQRLPEISNDTFVESWLIIRGKVV